MSHLSIISKTLREAARLGQEECQRPKTGRRRPPLFLGEFTLEKGGPGMWPYEGGEAGKDGSGAGMGEVNSDQLQTGKGSRKRLNHPRADSLPRHAQTQLCSQEPARVPTLLFLKLTRNGLVGLSCTCRPKGCSGSSRRAVPMAHYLLAGRPARHSVTQGFLLAQGLGLEEGGLRSHLFWPNGNTPPRAPETPEGQP